MEIIWLGGRPVHSYPADLVTLRSCCATLPLTFNQGVVSTPSLPGLHFSPVERCAATTSILTASGA